MTGWSPQVDKPQEPEKFDPLNLAGIVRGCDRPGGQCEFCDRDGHTGYIGLIMCQDCTRNVRAFLREVAKGRTKP